MTLVELLFILLWIGGGAFIGSRIGAPFGPTVSAFGAFVGAVIGFGIILLLGRLLRIQVEAHPPCRCGKNNQADFKVFDDPDWGFVDRCACGLRYFRDGYGSLWYEILSNGDARLFMQRDFWLHWNPPNDTTRAKQLIKRPTAPPTQDV